MLVTLQVIGHECDLPGRAGPNRGPSDTGPIWPGRAGRPRGHSDPSASPPGQLVDPTGPSCPGHLVDPVGLLTSTGVARESWSTPRGLRYGPELPRRASQHRRPSDWRAIRPGELFESSVPWTRDVVARDSGSNPRALGHRPESPRSASRPLGAIGPERDLPRRAGRNCGPSDPGPRHTGQLVNTAGNPTQDRVARNIWSTGWAFGHGPESPWTAG